MCAFSPPSQITRRTQVESTLGLKMTSKPHQHCGENAGELLFELCVLAHATAVAMSGVNGETCWVCLADKKDQDQHQLSTRLVLRAGATRKMIQLTALGLSRCEKGEKHSTDDDGRQTKTSRKGDLNSWELHAPHSLHHLRFSSRCGSVKSHSPCLKKTGLSKGSGT